ncbi:hypothetical protein [Klebsiella oxytoca]|uniref:hypothetical protein n=1 Tax=Klebsiella oxytoca TaxID=571 RepID=UPI000F509B45|nr:hypothetical protein [Klebsiella oxytoca]AYZ54165.1 hypothetical protein EGY21_23510 [Klebsiella oxytoca]EIX9050734.1 hypothetical protein [Klebsiella oxytoca]EJM1002559.1 hypothetical protein [Klebsiella oxytoca]EJV1068213.1 hypothetical protein [Klebsiella oxytoca]EKQ7238079.1 hypothetical protein [Klebsiella oxytoca]
MKELTQYEMENVSGAGLFDLPCALVDFTIQSALGLMKVGFDGSLTIAKTALETSLDMLSNLLSGSPSSIGSILADHLNSMMYEKSGIWSNFVYDAATNWGDVVSSLQK